MTKEEFCKVHIGDFLKEQYPDDKEALLVEVDSFIGDNIAYYKKGWHITHYTFLNFINGNC